MAVRIKSLHHNLKEGENVIFHRYHRSKKGRNPSSWSHLQKFTPSMRRKWKNSVKVNDLSS